jgi:hypothetical protein
LAAYELTTTRSVGAVSTTFDHAKLLEVWVDKTITSF